MSVANVWMLSAIVLPAGQVIQITDQDYRAGLSEILERGSGTVDNEFAAVGEAKPMLSFTTTALATVLGLVGLDGYAITSQTDFYFAQVAQGGMRGGAGTHIKMTLTNGMVVPKSLSASQGQPAKLTYDLYPISTDGVTAPIVIATAQSLPTIPIVSELFTLGPAWVNANALAALQSMNWEFSPQMEHVAGDGQAYPTFCGMTGRSYSCALNMLDLTALSTLGLNGLPLANFRTFLRKIVKGSTRVADATASHIKISGTTGMLLPRGARGPNNRPLSGDWNIVPTYDGTNACVALSTASAIA